MSLGEWQEGFAFQVIAHDSRSQARLGELKTPHGVITTPAFMPVGTYGAVKGISPDELVRAGAEIVLANALHLEFRPGSEAVAKLGGLHRLMGWPGPILTDSGGFQTYSLSALARQKESGIEIQSPVNGSKHLLTPEKIVQIQRNLGTDFMMPLDICAPGEAERETIEEALEQTLIWAQASRRAFDISAPLHGKPQALLGILQGGIHADLRERAAQELLKMEFFGYALGGLAVGESPERRWETVELCDRLIPKDNLRYLMGVGTPEDLRQAVKLGIDLFDCVLPTRNGRKGSLFTSTGKINLRNAAFRNDVQALDQDCLCYSCQIQADGRPKFSRGAIRHLLTSGDPLGARLGALHNLTFFLKTMADLRREIRENSTADQVR